MLDCAGCLACLASALRPDLLLGFQGAQLLYANSHRNLSWTPAGVCGMQPEPVSPSSSRLTQRFERSALQAKQEGHLAAIAQQEAAETTAMAM